MSKETRAKIKPKPVVIKTRPLRSLEVMMVRGGNCPGYRPVSWEDMVKILSGHKMGVL
jgi:hypothetical protein